jgi:hypothetical protein
MTSMTPSTRAVAWAQDPGPEFVDPRLLDFSVSDSEQQDKPFLLVGSALAALFVVGMAALVAALAISGHFGPGGP